MACHDPFCDDERIEVRWLRPGGVVAESYNLTLCSPQEAVNALERLYNTLAEWKENSNGRNSGKFPDRDGDVSARLLPRT